MAKHGLPLGIDVGGSGVKGAPVDLSTGDVRRQADADRHPGALDARRRSPP